MKDSLLVFDYEGQDSPAGSVCSIAESDHDLRFLDDLGVKFKTLSEICIPKMPVPRAPKAEPVFKQTVNRTIESPIVKPQIVHGSKTMDVKTTTVNKTSSTSNVKSPTLKTFSLPPFPIPVRWLCTSSNLCTTPCSL